MKTKNKILTVCGLLNWHTKKRDKYLKNQAIQLLILAAMFFFSMSAFAVTCEEDPDDPNCIWELPDTQAIPWDDDFWDNPWYVDGFDDPNDGDINGNAQLCFELNEATPDNCYTDPGNPDDLDYSQWIDDNLGEILQFDCMDGNCELFDVFPYMTEELVHTILTLFAQSFYGGYDYVTARNDILDTLVQPCYDNDYTGIKNPLAGFLTCVGHQVEFFYSMNPSSTEASPWTAGVSIRTPSGVSVSFGLGQNHENQNWVGELLDKVSADRLCHSWYQALASAQCGLGILP